jgi:hypothetical protein
LPDIVRTELDQMTTAFTRPVRRDAVAQLLRLVTQRTQALLVTPIPGSAQLGVCLAGPKGVVLRTVDVPASAVALADSLAREGLDRGARLGDLAPLASLLPAVLTAGLDPDLPLVIVPLDHLWAVPWPAFPLSDGHVLGETVSLGVTPSLSIAAHVLAAGARASRPQTVALWRNPSLNYHGVHAFDDHADVHPYALPSASHARDVILGGGYDLVVAAAHGKPMPELGHYLELDETTLLTPADVLTAHPPALVALVSCWGAVAPGGPDGDPLTLATILAARGATAVLASTSEVADDRRATSFVNDILYKTIRMPMAAAVREATRAFLRRERDGLLAEWAPIVTVGSPLEARHDRPKP